MSKAEILARLEGARKAQDRAEEAEVRALASRAGHAGRTVAQQATREAEERARLVAGLRGEGR